jgi:hypothetical protein
MRNIQRIFRETNPSVQFPEAAVGVEAIALLAGSGRKSPEFSTD